jgi:hypothetical protein
MNSIAISFSLKGTKTLAQIDVALAEIASKYDVENTELVHGFLSRDEVVERCLLTDLVDVLDTHFPKQYIFSGYEFRKLMAEYIQKQHGIVFIIGDIVEGVREEYEIYKELLPEDRIVLIP